MPTDQAANQLSREQVSRTWEAYRNNLLRKLGVLTTDIETRLMTGLSADGFDDLKLAYAAPLSALAGGGKRLTVLATQLGISKQLCRQQLLPIQRAGYIQTRPDLTDARAKVITLTPSGHKLLQAAYDRLAELESGYARSVGSETLQQLAQDVSRCLGKLATGTDAMPEIPLLVSAQAGLLTRRLQLQLMQRLHSFGHTGLQPSFGQVMEHLHPTGRELQELAELHRVTPQAIYRIAGKLQQLGYVDKERRQDKTVLLPTRKGIQLLQDADRAMSELLQQLANNAGAATLARVDNAVNTLWQAIGGTAQQPDALTAADWQALLDRYNHDSAPKWQPGSPLDAPKTQRNATAWLLEIYLPRLQQRLADDDATATSLIAALQTEWEALPTEEKAILANSADAAKLLDVLQPGTH